MTPKQTDCMALMYLPNVVELHESPDGFSRKEWWVKRHNGTTDHYHFIQVRSGNLIHRAMICMPEHGTFAHWKPGVYELFFKLPDPIFSR